jgi:hypothetical protein
MHAAFLFVPVTLTKLASNAACIFCRQMSTMVVLLEDELPPEFVEENGTPQGGNDRAAIRGRKARAGIIMTVQSVKMYSKET